MVFHVVLVVVPVLFSLCISGIPWSCFDLNKHLVTSVTETGVMLLNGNEICVGSTMLSNQTVWLITGEIQHISTTGRKDDRNRQQLSHLSPAKTC